MTNAITSDRQHAPFAAALRKISGRHLQDLEDARTALLEHAFGYGEQPVSPAARRIAEEYSQAVESISEIDEELDALETRAADVRTRLARAAEHAAHVAAHVQAGGMDDPLSRSLPAEFARRLGEIEARIFAARARRAELLKRSKLAEARFVAHLHVAPPSPPRAVMRTIRFRPRHHARARSRRTRAASSCAARATGDPDGDPEPPRRQRTLAGGAL